MEHIVYNIPFDEIARGIYEISREELSKNEVDNLLLSRGKQNMLCGLTNIVLENKEYKIKIKRIPLTTKEFNQVESIVKNMCKFNKKKFEKTMEVLKDWEPFNLECEIE